MSERGSFVYGGDMKPMPKYVKAASDAALKLLKQSRRPGVVMTSNQLCLLETCVMLVCEWKRKHEVK